MLSLPHLQSYSSLKGTGDMSIFQPMRSFWETEIELAQSLSNGGEQHSLVNCLTSPFYLQIERIYLRVYGDLDYPTPTLRLSSCLSSMVTLVFLPDSSACIYICFNSSTHHGAASSMN